MPKKIKRIVSIEFRCNCMRIKQNLTQKKNIEIKFLKPKVVPKVMPNMKICRTLGMGQKRTFAQYPFQSMQLVAVLPKRFHRRL